MTSIYSTFDRYDHCRTWTVCQGVKSACFSEGIYGARRAASIASQMKSNLDGGMTWEDAYRAAPSE